MRFNNDFFDSRIEDTWPHLTHLQIPHQTADATILTSLSKFPKLQYLLVLLDLDEVDPTAYYVNPAGYSLHSHESAVRGVLLRPAPRTSTTMPGK